MDNATQRGKILAYCREHGSITARDAVVKLNINSPRKRISELRQSPDYEVEAIEERRPDPAGGTVRYKRYFIKKAVAADG